MIRPACKVKMSNLNALSALTNIQDENSIRNVPVEENELMHVGEQKVHNTMQNSPQDVLAKTFFR